MRMCGCGCRRDVYNADVDEDHNINSNFNANRNLKPDVNITMISAIFFGVLHLRHPRPHIRNFCILLEVVLCEWSESTPGTVWRDNEIMLSVICGMTPFPICLKPQFTADHCILASRRPQIASDDRRSLNILATRRPQITVYLRHEHRRWVMLFNACNTRKLRQRNRRRHCRHLLIQSLQEGGMG